MITYVVGDLFTSPAKVLVNTVNTVGVMGKGIAKDFKRIYQEMFEEYQDLCEQEMFNVGQLWLYKTPHKWILNFPTKKHWRGKSKIDYIEAGLRKFVDTYDSKGMLSVSFPMLGCGNGELDWEKEVQPLMEEYLQPLPINVYIHVFPKGNNFAPAPRKSSTIKQESRSNVSPKRNNFTPVPRKSSTIRQESESNKISYNPKSDFWDERIENYLTEATAHPARKWAAESAARPSHIWAAHPSSAAYLTKEGEADLRRELEELEVRYHALTQELKDRNTDLHHMDAGSGYRDRFVMDLELVAYRIRYIQETLGNATIIEDNGPSDEVRIGSTVVIREDGTNEDEEYKIAGVATRSEGKISYKSPIGAALLGKEKGQKVKALTPDGSVTFEIIDIR